MEKFDIMEYISEMENGLAFDIALAQSGMKISRFKRELFENGGERGIARLLKRLQEEVPELPEIIKEYGNETSLNKISEKLCIAPENIINAITMYRFLKGQEAIVSKKNKLNNIKEEHEL